MSALALFVSFEPIRGRKDTGMKLKMQYGFETQEVEVDVNDMWVSLSIDESDVDPSMPKEEIVQKEFDEKFNKPEYNNERKAKRYISVVKKDQRKIENHGQIFEIADFLEDNSFEEEINANLEYEEITNIITSSVKEEYADVIISVYLDDKTPEKYAFDNNVSIDAVRKRIQRAKKKLRKIFEKCPNLLVLKAN